MAKRPVYSPGLLDASSVASPAPVRVPVPGLSSAQQSRARVVANSLQRDITRFQQQLACPLPSWEEQGHQAIQANAALAFALKAVAEFLPDELQSLVAQFTDLRGQVVLRTFEEN